MQLWGYPEDLETFMAKNNIQGYVCWLKSDQVICFQHKAIPFKEQVGFPPTNTKQCIYAYAGASSIYFIIFFSSPFFFLECLPLDYLPADLLLPDITTGKRQHVKDNQFQYGKSVVFKIQVSSTKSSWM